MQQKTMRAIELTESGGLSIVERPVPVPAKGQVLIRIEACFITPEDLHNPGAALPRIPGSGIAGRIEAVGHDVPAWRLGDRVVVDPGLPKGPENNGIAGRDRDGGLTEFVLADAFDAIAAPEGLCAGGLAAIGSAWTLAERVVSWGRVFEGEKVLILGAESSAGQAAMTLAALRGAEPITAVPASGDVDVIADFRANAEELTCEQHLKPGGIYVSHRGQLKYKGQNAVSTLGRTDIYTIEALERVLHMLERGKLQLPAVNLVSWPSQLDSLSALSGQAVAPTQLSLR